MADRILNWYLPEVTGDGTNQGATYCLDKSYALPARVRIYAVRAPDGGDLVVDIKDDGESIFGTHKVSTVNTRFDYSRIHYRTLTLGTFQYGETVTGNSSTATGIVMLDEGGILSINLLTKTIFTVDEYFTGGTSSAKAYVTSFYLGGVRTKFDITLPSFYAVLVDGENSEEHAGSFAPDKTAMRQYSWITLDVVQSGGAKQISVQLELDHEYKEEEPDEMD